MLRALFPERAIEIEPRRAAAGRCLANDRPRRELGFEPRYTLEIGLEAYLEDVAPRDAVSA